MILKNYPPLILLLVTVAFAVSSCDNQLTQPDTKPEGLDIPAYGSTALPGSPHFSVLTGTQGQPTYPPAYHILIKYSKQHHKEPYIAVAGVWNAKKQQYKYKALPLTFSRNQIRKANGKIAYYHYQLRDSTGRRLRSLAGLFPATLQAKYIMAHWLQLPDKGTIKSVETKIIDDNNLQLSGSQEMGPVKNTMVEDPVENCPEDEVAWCSELDETTVTAEAPDNNEDDNQTDDDFDHDSIWPPANDEGGYPSDDHHSGGNSDGTPPPEECTSSIVIGPLPTLIDPSQDPKGGGDDDSNPGSSDSAPCGDSGDDLAAEQLKDLLEQDEFALLKDPCDEIGKYQALADFTPTDPAVVNKLEDLKNFSSVIVGAFDIEKIQNAAGDIVNMDEFSVQVDNLPGSMSASDFLHHIRTHINNFLDTDYGDFSPYDQFINNSSYPFNDTEKWNSHDPIGAVMYIDIPGDDGSVIVSGHTSHSWTFSTISAPFTWDHPVSGNRKFGFTQNGDGSYSFYTKGIDRITDSTNETFAQQLTFNGADDLWTSFQKGIKDYINAHGGNATMNEPEKVRPDWEQLQKVFNGQADVESLEDCN